MDSKKINEVPWQQGRLLETAITRRMGHAERDEADREEKRRVFAWFCENDQGRSRELVCVCRCADEAKAMAEAHNRHIVSKVHKAEAAIADLKTENSALKATLGRVKEAWLHIDDWMEHTVEHRLWGRKGDINNILTTTAPPLAKGGE